MQHTQLYTVKEVAQFLKISVSGVWDKVKNEATFPKPLKLSAKQTRWTDTQLNAFILAKIAASATLH
jgi:predicted DNA-binding transcriptional regulator AlpA